MWSSDSSWGPITYHCWSVKTLTYRFCDSIERSRRDCRVRERCKDGRVMNEWASNTITAYQQSEYLKWYKLRHWTHLWRIAVSRARGFVQSHGRLHGHWRQLNDLALFINSLKPIFLSGSRVSAHFSGSTLHSTRACYRGNYTTGQWLYMFFPRPWKSTALNTMLVSLKRLNSRDIFCNVF